MGASPAGEPLLSVVIPAFNEERRIVPTLRAFADHLAAQPYAWEIVVADDGSRDRTTAVVQELARSVPGLRVLTAATNRGKGFAVRTGYLAARGRLVLFSDADGSTPIDEFGRLRDALDRTGSAVAVGSRALPDSDVRVKQAALRQGMGQGFNLLVRLMSGLQVHDTQCGFKLFRRAECLPVFELQRLDGFAFDVELLFIARRLGLGLVEVPVVWINSPDSRVSVWRDPLAMARDLVRIRWNALRGRYGPGAA